MYCTCIVMAHFPFTISLLFVCAFFYYLVFIWKLYHNQTHYWAIDRIFTLKVGNLHLSIALSPSVSVDWPCERIALSYELETGLWREFIVDLTQVFLFLQIHSFNSGLNKNFKKNRNENNNKTNKLRWKFACTIQLDQKSTINKDKFNVILMAYLL